jgi:membrane-associated phospholipid phosphatase
VLIPRWVSAFDAAVGDLVFALRTPALTRFLYLCTLLANTGTVVSLTLAAVVVLAVRRRFAEAILVVVVVAGGQALGTLAKSLVVRARPPASGALIPLPGSYAFPSGHSLAAALLYGVLAFLIVRSLHSRSARVAVAAGAVVLVALVGLSRVYLGVHWASDVVAAWVLGGAWLGLCAWVYVRWSRGRTADGARVAAPRD